MRSGARNAPRRLILVFALSVLIPAIALAVMAYRTVSQEKRALFAERRSDLTRAALVLKRELTDAIEDLKAREDSRPYYQYNPVFFDSNAVGYGTNYFKSPISERPPNPLVNGYFNFDSEGKVGSPNDAVAQLKDEPGRRDRALQQGRTKKTIDNAKKNLLPEFEAQQELAPQSDMGQFEGQIVENRSQWVTPRAVVANHQAKQKAEQLLLQTDQDNVPQAAATRQQAAQDTDFVEVIVSPFLARPGDDGDVIFYRYVDVPNPSGALGDAPFFRYAQGFTLDAAYLRGEFFDGLVERHMDVPGGRATLGVSAPAAPGGEIVYSDSLPALPGYTLAVADTDPGWVGRRVARHEAVLIAVAGALLLVIAGGATFTVRAVRTELALARRKSEFVAAVSHELRTPLTGIKMYADMLDAGWVKDEETRAEYVGFMATETDRLARLVNRVLDFARSERSERNLVPVDLAELVAEVERDLTDHAAQAGFAVQTEVVDDRRVLADRDAVKQILLNLVENAVKYAADATERTILIRAAPEERRTVLSVVDHGPGVPDAEKDRIFADFYRSGKELTRETTGVGIGLALVRRLAEAMGGTVAVEDTPGGGATFTLRLRRVRRVP